MMSSSKPPKLFSFAPDVELQALRGAGLCVQNEEALQPVLFSFAAIAGAKRLTDEVLQPLVDGCRGKFEFVRGVAIHRLVVLGHYFPEAADALVRVCVDSDVDVRRQALPHLVMAPPKVTTKILRYAISDTEQPIRKAALLLAKDFSSRKLERLLEERLVQEESEELRTMIVSLLESEPLV